MNSWALFYHADTYRIRYNSHSQVSGKKLRIRAACVSVLAALPSAASSSGGAGCAPSILPSPPPLPAAASLRASEGIQMTS